MNKRVLLTIWLAAVVWVSHAQFLKTEGIKIVNDQGEEVIFRGIGLGGWMLQEGYMLRTGGPQHEIKARIKALIGEEKTDEFYDVWLANHTRKIDVDSMASWGYNLIRLPMHYGLFTPAIQEEPVQGQITYTDKGFEMVDDLVSWCKANNIWLILDMHAAPGGQGENKDISDYDPSKPSLWDSEANQVKMIALWKKLAERYKDEPTIAAYDIINEPNWGFQNHASDPNGCSESSNAPLWDLQKKITAAIREVDQNHIIVIEGNCWGNNYNGLPGLWDSNIAISYHKYWNANDQGSIAGMLSMRASKNVPIWLGETGENSNTWFADAVELFENNHIGWSWWPLKKLGGNNPLEIKVHPDYQKVLDFWGGGAKPSQEVAVSGLMGFAENLKLENNIYHPDVVDAKIRQPHTNDTKAFKYVALGKEAAAVVQASDFDLGRNGYAYWDKDATNETGNPGGLTWNQGYAYRNDGVDIQKTTDVSEIGNGYNVGWTEDGEWLLYTVNVSASGSYELTIRYSAPSKTTVHLEIDGVNVSGPIELPSTGGYLKWADLVLKDLPIYEGSRKLKFVFDKGGANFAYMRFFFDKALEEIAFIAKSAETSDAGGVVLSVNKYLDESTISGTGFTLTVNAAEVAISGVTLAGENQLELVPAVDLVDTDVVTIKYSGTAIKATDATVLQAFENIEVTNLLPKYSLLPGKIQAEDFYVNEGLALESTTDTGGGQNLGYTSTGDYTEYRINVPETGDYKLDVRVACFNNAGKLQFLQIGENNKVLGSVEINVPVTGGWQTWQTVSGQINLTAGRTVLRMKIQDPEFNINWFEFKQISNVLGTPAEGVEIFPNPTQGWLKIKGISGQEAQLSIVDLQGKVILETCHQLSESLDVSVISPGVYILKINASGGQFNQKLIIR